MPLKLRAIRQPAQGRWTTVLLGGGADGVKEAGVSDLGGVLREFDIDPGDDVTERPVLERPSGSLRRSQVVVSDLLEYRSPLSLQLAEPSAYGVGIARPHHD